MRWCQHLPLIRACAEATSTSRCTVQMYYNMRIKTMHRNARNIIKMAAEGKRVSQGMGRIGKGAKLGERGVNGSCEIII